MTSHTELYRKFEQPVPHFKQHCLKLEGIVILKKVKKLLLFLTRLNYLRKLTLLCSRKTSLTFWCLDYLRQWVQSKGWVTKKTTQVFGSFFNFQSDDAFLKFREVKHHVYVKRQTPICTTWLSFLFTGRLLFIISTPTLVVSRNFLSVRNVLSCFYLLILLFWEILNLNLTFAVYVKLKLSFIILINCEILLQLLSLIFIKISLQQLLSQNITISVQFNVIWLGWLPFLRWTYITLSLGTLWNHHDNGNGNVKK